MSAEAPDNEDLRKQLNRATRENRERRDREIIGLDFYRHGIFQEIQIERAKQDAEWGGFSHDIAHGTHDWIAFIAKHLGRAAEAGIDSFDPDADPRSVRDAYRYAMIRIASLAVACAEAIDRTKDAYDRVKDA